LAAPVVRTIEMGLETAPFSLGAFSVFVFSAVGFSTGFSVCLSATSFCAGVFSVAGVGRSALVAVREVEGGGITLITGGLLEGGLASCAVLGDSACFETRVGFSKEEVILVKSFVDRLRLNLKQTR
jgi:hypothetical protein